MPSDLNPSLLKILSDAVNSAAVATHTPDLVYLTLRLIDSRAAASFLRAAGVNPFDLRERLYRAIDERGTEAGTTTEPMRLSPLVRHVVNSSGLSGSPLEMIREIWSLPRDEYGGEPDFVAVEIMRGMEAEAKAMEAARVEMEAARARDAVLWFDGATPEAFQQPPPEPREPTTAERLAAFCVDLTAIAERGGLDPVFGRDEEIARVAQILSRRKKNNPVLIGEPGTGKTAIVEGLAMRIADGECLKGARLYSLDVMKLVGGTRNRGDLEERLQEIVATASQDPNCILFIDEIHVISGGVAGAADAGNLLKPALASGAIRCVGATTWSEYGRFIDPDPALSRRFLPVHVKEPDRETAVMLLKGVAPSYERHHAVTFAEGVLEAAVDLTTRHVHGRFLPDKAIDVLDEAGSTAAARGMKIVDERLVREVVSRMSGVDVEAGPANALAAVRKLAEGSALTRGAYRELARAMARAETELSGPRATRATILFVGPGKSGEAEAAQALANALGVALCHIDMRAYRESHSMSRLVGSPPGYVGYAQGGQMTEALRRNPSCVLLVERIDLAHPDVASAILKALATGRMTDSTGREVSLAGAVVVATAVHEGEASRPIGFSARAEEHDAELPEAARPFAEVADGVVRFRRPEVSDLAALALEWIARMESALASKGVSVTVEGREGIAKVVSERAMRYGGSEASLRTGFRELVENPVLDALPAERLRLWSEGREIHVTHGEHE